MSTYDSIGGSYSARRRPDPRIERRIRRALGGATSVVNVGAGTGSYEPSDRPCVAVDPSRVMLCQRGRDAAPAVQGRAERLPLPDDAVDAAMAVLTIHHWSDPMAGLAELCRVARRLVVVLTWDQAVWSSFWLLRDYFPDCDLDRRRAVPIAEITSALGGGNVIPVPIPHDCVDGFHGAFWRRPGAYLDPAVRAGISTYSQMPRDQLERGLGRLEADLENGAWYVRNRGLVDREELDLGYRLIVSQL